ncbi:MAG: phosphatidylserine decarboxylase, partial [Lachnospiraceae bacterium]|nr:phosphatidylserine decarboxylase [Lachnospiraceae bacterium]
MKIYDRENKTYEEIEQFGAGKLEFLYNNAFGRLFLWLAVSPLVSGINGKINSTKKSAKKIPDFIKEQGIDMRDFEDREYTSFNDFFTRKLREGKRVVDTNPTSLIAPADSKLLVYRIEEGMRLFVKGREYTVNEILEDDTL